MRPGNLALVEPIAEEYFVGYGRVSADEQAKGESVDHQSQWCAEEAQRLGGMMIAFFFDRPHTGTIVFGRPGIEAAVAFAKEQGLRTIVARDTSRLHRNADEFREFERKVVTPAGVRFRTNIGHRHGGGVGSYVTTQSIDMAVTVYSMMLSDSTKDGKHRLVQAGYWPAPPPVGYKRRERPKEGFDRRQRRFVSPEDRELVPDPTWAPIVRGIFEDRSKGIPTRQIASELTARSVPSPRTGSVWHKSMVEKILRNPLYMGLIHRAGIVLLDPEGEPIRMKGEALIDEATWKACQPSKGSGAPSRADRYAFKGLLYTSHFMCLTPPRRRGHKLPLVGKAHDERVRYRPAHLIYEAYQVEALDELAEYFPWALDASAVDETLIRCLVEETKDDPDLVVVPAQRQGEAAQLRALLKANREAQETARSRRDAALDMRIRDAAKEQDKLLRKAEAEGRALETRLQALARRRPAAAPPEAVHVLKEAWEQGNIEGCQRILQQMVSHVDVRVLGPPRQNEQGEWESPIGFDVYLLGSGDNLLVGGKTTTC